MRREDLLSRGVSRREIQGAQERGTLMRHYRGCYALPDAPAGAVAATALRGALTCVTALREWGAPILGRAPAGVHIAVPRNRGVTAADPRVNSTVVGLRCELLQGRGPGLVHPIRGAP